MRVLTWVVLVPLAITIVCVLVRFAGYGFSFADVNKVMAPFYRNKVAFACMCSVFLPFIWFMRQGYPRHSLPRILLTAALVLVITGVQFSYTRAAYVTIAMGIGAYYLIRWRLIKIALAGAAAVAILYAASMVTHNSYLDHKPVYEKTITHEDFNDLLNATTKGRDVSTMERVYRWVAAGHMIAEKPWLGWGPGTFTAFYKTYTIAGFRTYVSENKEGSGIHSYYLMTLVEQGYIGLILFVALLFLVLIKGEMVYHQTTDPSRRRMLSVALVTAVIIDGLLLINDLVETDKIGSFFFLCMAIVVNVDLENKRLST
jgi:O-antigen ligase